MRRRACWCRPPSSPKSKPSRSACAEVIVGDPTSATTNVGPLVSKVQFDRVERYIEKGIAEGAKLVAGGSGRPAGLSKGYYVKPTVFSNVRNDMTIAREEIFGPVLCILPYEIRGAGDRDRERHALRSGSLCVVQGLETRGTRGRPDSRRTGRAERRLGRHADPVRRLQDVRKRTRVWGVRPARLPRGQGRHRRRRRLRRWELWPAARYSGSRISGSATGPADRCSSG